MSAPPSKLLKASKSIMAIADLKHNCPDTKQAQNVNIVVNPTYMEKKVSYPPTEHAEAKAAAPAAAKESVQTASVETQPIQVPPQDKNPYEEVAAQRGVESAMDKTNETCKDIISEKENVIRALSLIIEIIQHNPLIVNKYIVAEEESLKELIRLLTNTVRVEIDLEDVDCSCTGSKKYRIIKRIWMVDQEGNQYSLPQLPVIMRLFDNYRISLNLVIA